MTWPEAFFYTAMFAITAWIAMAMYAIKNKWKG